MKVDIVDPSLFTAPYDAELVNALKLSGIDVKLVGRKARVDEDEVRCDVFKFFYFPFGDGIIRKYPLLKAAVHAFYLVSYLIFAICFRRVDVIHFQWLPIPVVDSKIIMFFKLFSNVRLVFTAHNTNAFHGTATSSLQSIGWRKSLEVFDYIQVHTKDVKGKLLGMGVDASKVIVAPHGLLPVEQPSESSFISGKYILMYGNFKPYKGADLLVDAYSELCNRGGDIDEYNLVLAGRFSYPVSSLLEGKKIDRIIVKNEYLSDFYLSSLVYHSEVCVFPYRDIDASGALTLAVQHEKPLVLSDLHGLTEVVGGEKGSFIFENGSVDALAKCLEEAVERKTVASEKARESKVYYERNYSWGTAVDILKEVYSGE